MDNVDENGDFVTGAGKSIRFWAVNTSVEREKPFRKRPRWNPKEPDIAAHARWLAKHGRQNIAGLPVPQSGDWIFILRCVISFK